MVIKIALTSRFRKCLLITFFECFQKNLLTNQQIVSFVVSSNDEKISDLRIMLDAKPCLKCLVFERAFWEMHVFLELSSLRKGTLQLLNTTYKS